MAYLIEIELYMLICHDFNLSNFRPCHSAAAKVMKMMLIVLAGIKIAAITGASRPCNAKNNPTIL